jgi:voltage-gated potassium channel
MSKFVTALIMLVAILSFGTFGYMFIEHSSFMDSLYMTMITISTIGFGEVFPLDTKGRIFTMVLILVGVGFVMFMFSKITEAVVGGELRAIYGRLNMKKKVLGLTDHYIICGFGRIGRVICNLLKEADKPFVVIENDPEVIQELADLNYLFLDGVRPQATTCCSRPGSNGPKGLSPWSPLTPIMSILPCRPEV